jgi:hypothetical protein
MVGQVMSGNKTGSRTANQTVGGGLGYDGRRSVG